MNQLPSIFIADNVIQFESFLKNCFNVVKFGVRGDTIVLKDLALA